MAFVLLNIEGTWFEQSLTTIYIYTFYSIIATQHVRDGLALINRARYSNLFPTNKRVVQPVA